LICLGTAAFTWGAVPARVNNATDMQFYADHEVRAGMDEILKQHSGELTILVLSSLVLLTLLLLAPQLLRSHLKVVEIQHTERMKALEQGISVRVIDDRSLFAGRTALLVPIVSVCTAGTVTCFLAAYKVDILFSVSLAVWSVAGIVSLAALTGCVALLGRLAQLQAGVEDEELALNPLENREKQSRSG